MRTLIKDANFPHDEEGKVYHIGVKYGQVANRILTVGDHVRAKAIAECLDSEAEAGHPTFVYVSKRNFLTITGRYKGVPVSIMAIGMGNPMMDFFIRETRAVVTGTMAVVRFGSCGSLTLEAPPGAVVVPKGGYCIRRNIDYFSDHPINQDLKKTPYLISGLFSADPDLTKRLSENVTKTVAKLSVGGPVLSDGLNADGCSFYSSQGRKDSRFWDDNEHVIKQALALHPDTHSLEMETSMLFHLAKCARGEKIRAAGCMQVFADRVGNDFIRPEVVEVLEPAVGAASLDTLIETPIEDEMDEIGTVWERAAPLCNNNKAL